MGLDAYMWSTPVVPTKQVDFNFEVYGEEPDKPKPTEIAYWRKCWPLQTWMETLYYKKNGTASSFNCAIVQLTVEDLTQLMDDVSGFNIDDHQINDILSVAEEALSHILLTGETIFYDSWW